MTQITEISEHGDKERGSHSRKEKGTKGKGKSKHQRKGQNDPHGTGAASSSEQHDGSQRNLEDVGFKRQRVRKDRQLKHTVKK